MSDQWIDPADPWVDPADAPIGNGSDPWIDPDAQGGDDRAGDRQDPNEGMPVEAEPGNDGDERTPSASVPDIEPELSRTARLDSDLRRELVDAIKEGMADQAMAILRIAGPSEDGVPGMWVLATQTLLGADLAPAIRFRHSPPAQFYTPLH